MSVNAPGLHPLASEHLPYFITAPGGSDQMLYVVAAILVAAVLMLGGFYFWLHSLPERLAHKRRRTQMELVAVLGLIGLFTHNNLFWIAALLLAMIELPTISNPMARMAESLEKLSTLVPSKAASDTTAMPKTSADQTDAATQSAALTASPATPNKPAEGA